MWSGPWFPPRSSRHFRQTLSLPPQASARAHPTTKRAAASCFRRALGSLRFLHTPSQGASAGFRLRGKPALEQRTGRSRRGCLGATARAREDVASTPYACVSSSHDRGGARVGGCEVPARVGLATARPAVVTVVWPHFMVAWKGERWTGRRLSVRERRVRGRRSTPCLVPLCSMARPRPSRLPPFCHRALVLTWRVVQSWGFRWKVAGRGWTWKRGGSRD